MDTRTRERAADLFSALSSSSRLRIVEALFEGPKTVNEIAAALGTSQSGTSQNLSILTRVGILAVEQRGTCRIYRVRGPRMAAILQLIEEFCHIHALYGSADEEGTLE